MEQRKGLIFKNEWKNAFELLDAESAKRLILAAIDYSENGTECRFDYAEEVSVFDMIKRSIDNEKGRK